MEDKLAATEQAAKRYNSSTSHLEEKTDQLQEAMQQNYGRTTSIYVIHRYSKTELSYTK